MENEYPLMHGIGDLRMGKHPIPEIGPHDVLVKISKVGLCGSDLSVVYKGRLGDRQVPLPAGVGHEAAGVIVKRGSAVKNLAIGDRVAIEPGGNCGMCEYCKSGKYNNCPDACFHSAAGPTPTPGMLARYFQQRADLCFKLPDNVSQEEGAIIEPLAVAIHGCRRAKVTAGSSVLICGAGPIGLLTLLVAKAMGATNILTTDIKESRLLMAKKMGSDRTLLVKGEAPQDLAKKVGQVMGCMPEITFECSGVDDCLRTAIFATRSGGAVILAGIGTPEVKLPIVNAAVREVDLVGIFRYTNCYPIAINMIAKGLIDVGPLITHRFKFEEFNKAFEMFKDGADGAIKCMISCE
ncbi:sorbitol dehydrogenase-like [Palaemon carinicauda]|uniref:sorbitol dehydrogenase-like n=1 Tax=Palaemon carinicauda TaxID=392227 RepID=UPI0035B58E39